jgi:hypothetical protein
MAAHPHADGRADALGLCLQGAIRNEPLAQDLAGRVRDLSGCRSLLTTALVAAQLPGNVPEARMIRPWAVRASAGDRVRGLPRRLGRPPLKLPCREAPDVDVELVQPGIVAVVRKLDLELKLLLAHGQLADRAGGADAWTSPRPCLRQPGGPVGGARSVLRGADDRLRTARYGPL